MKHKSFCDLGEHIGRCGRLVSPSNEATPASLPAESDVYFIREQFRKLFAQTANLVEVLEPDMVKQESVKNLLGGFQNQTEHDILIRVQDKLK